MASPGKWVECGRFGRVWGVRGQITVFWTGGACPVKVGSGRVFTPGPSGDFVPLVVLSSRPHGKCSVVTLEGLKSPQDVAYLRNKEIYVPENVLPILPKDEFYCYQVLGLNVETEDGRPLGSVVKIFATGANDVYEVKPPKGETILIPAISSVVKKIDIENKKMIVRPIKGML